MENYNFFRMNRVDMKKKYIYLHINSTRMWTSFAKFWVKLKRERNTNVTIGEVYYRQTRKAEDSDVSFISDNQYFKDTQCIDNVRFLLSRLKSNCQISGILYRTFIILCFSFSRTQV